MRSTWARVELRGNFWAASGSKPKKAVQRRQPAATGCLGPASPRRAGARPWFSCETLASGPNRVAGRGRGRLECCSAPHARCRRPHAGAAHAEHRKGTDRARSRLQGAEGRSRAGGARQQRVDPGCSSITSSRDCRSRASRAGALSRRSASARAPAEWARHQGRGLTIAVCRCAGGERSATWRIAAAEPDPWPLRFPFWPSSLCARTQRRPCFATGLGPASSADARPDPATRPPAVTSSLPWPLLSSPPRP